MAKNYCFLLLCMMIGFSANAQKDDYRENDWEEILESILITGDADIDYEQSFNILVQAHENPIDLNSASREDFNVLFFLTNSQIDSMLSYRSRHGSFLSVKELNFIEGLDLQTIRFLKSFVTVNYNRDPVKQGARYWLPESRKSLLTKIYRRLEKPAGFTNGSPGKGYLGSPERILSRVRLHIPNEISFGLAAEKDPGEPFLWSPQDKFYGFDHYSGHLALYNIGNLLNITVGSFKVQYGQGLVLGSGFYLGKSSETIASVDNKTTGIRPYTGSSEAGIFNGIAASLKFGRWKADTFLSFRNLDGRLDSIQDNGSVIIRSLTNTGLHRTAGEILRRKNVWQITGGSHISLYSTRQDLILGSSLVFTRFQFPYREDSGYYNTFRFQGSQLFTGGVDYRYVHRKFSVLGEVAASDNYSLGLVNGFIVNLSKNIESALSLRYYSRGFHSLYGNPLSEASSLENESGIYWGLKILPVRRIIINLFFDTFRFPWLRYNLRSPSSGYEILTKLIWDPPGRFECYGQYVRKNKDVSLRDQDQGIETLGRGIKNQFWLQGEISGESGILLKTRLQYSNNISGKEMSSGIAAFQDIGLKKQSFSIHARVIWFRTDDFLNRQYIYEQGTVYDFQVPSFYGNGLRLYTMITGKVGRHFRYWIKGGRVIYNDVESIGSGMETIPGNHRSDIMAQFEIFL